MKTKLKIVVAASVCCFVVNFANAVSLRSGREKYSTHKYKQWHSYIKIVFWPIS